jgi:hypothetical protein
VALLKPCSYADLCEVRSRIANREVVSNMVHGDSIALSACDAAGDSNQFPSSSIVLKSVMMPASSTQVQQYIRKTIEQSG